MHCYIATLSGAHASHVKLETLDVYCRCCNCLKDYMIYVRASCSSHMLLAHAYQALPRACQQTAGMDNTPCVLMNA